MSVPGEPRLRSSRGGLALALILSTVATTTAPAPAQEIWRQIRMVVPEQTLPNAVVGVPYHEIIEMAAGAAPVLWEATGPLAPGMELAADLDQRHAVLRGTPDIPGLYPFHLLAFDSRGDVASVELVLRVVELPPEILLDPSGDLDGDGKSNLEEHSMGTSFTEWDDPSSPRITIAPDTGGRPIMHVPLAPGATEVHRVAQAWDETTGTWTNIQLDPVPGEWFQDIGLPYSSNLASPVMGRVLFSIGAPTPQQKLLAIIEKLEEAAKKLKGHENELTNNPLVQQANLIRQIKSILGTPDEIKELLVKWLEDGADEYIPRLKNMNDEGFTEELVKIKRVLCYAKKLLEFLKDNINEGESQEEVERRELAVGAAIRAIEQLKNLIDDIEGGREWTPTFYDNLTEAIEDLEDSLKDKAKEYVREKIQATITDFLTRKLGGAGPAGVVISAATDAANLLSAYIEAGKWAEANAAYNILYKRMLELAYDTGFRMDEELKIWHDERAVYFDPNEDGESDAADCEEMRGKRVKVRAKLVYWKPELGEEGEQGRGKWEEIPVLIKDLGNNQPGDSTMEIDRESFETDVPGKCHLRYNVDWDDFKRKADGKRHVHLRIEYEIGNGSPRTLFSGVYRP